MDMMNHPRRLQPLVGRTPGGATPPTAADPDEFLPKLASSSDVTVGVVDTGISLDASGAPHAWFGTHLSYCREDDEDLPTPSRLGRQSIAADRAGDADGHGTFVAGLILHEAPTARIRMWGVLDAEQSGPDGLGPANDRAVAAAIRALAINPRVVAINLSFGGGVFWKDLEPTLLKAALADVDLTRVAVVAAAGNDEGAGPVYPAAFDGVISIGALDTTGPSDVEPPIAAFSNRGEWVDAYAAGVDVLGPALQRAPGQSGMDRGLVRPGWQHWSGTSFAAATVTGRIVALAIERGISGADAARALLAESPRLASAYGKPWVRGRSTPW